MIEKNTYNLNTDNELSQCLSFEDTDKHEDPKNETKTYRGAEEITKVLLNEIKLHGPFDGVLGFSQGSTAFRVFNILINSMP